MMTSSNRNISPLLAICAGNLRWPVNSSHKGQWRWALMFYLICAWINGWLNNGEAGDLRRYRAHYDAIGMCGAPLVRNMTAIWRTVNRKTSQWKFETRDNVTAKSVHHPKSDVFNTYRSQLPVSYSNVNRYPALSHQPSILQPNYICRSKIITLSIYNM